MNPKEIADTVQHLLENATALAVAVSMAAASVGAVIAAALKAWHSVRSNSAALTAVIQAIEQASPSDVKDKVSTLKAGLQPGARAALDKAVQGRSEVNPVFWHFPDPLVMAPLPDGVYWVFWKDFRIFRNGLLKVIPRGFMLDGASSGIFRGIVPAWGKYAAAVANHDFDYWNQLVPREHADDDLLSIMIACGVSWAQREEIYQAVRAFGQYDWDRNREQRRQDPGARTFDFSKPIEWGISNG